MKYKYNEKYFDGRNLKQARGNINAIRTFVMKDGVLIGMFQGKRGDYPRLDFVLKVLMPGEDKKMVTIRHIYWVVDFIIKAGKDKNNVKNIARYYLKFYRKVKPFSSKKQRDNYDPKRVNYITKKYNIVNKNSIFSMQCLATLLELFAICEKRNKHAYMFEDLLQYIIDYTESKCDYMFLIDKSQPIAK